MPDRVHEATAARYGLSIEQGQTAVQNAIGGENVTTTVEGRERQIPLGQLATITPMLKP